jgi:aspartyl-tRNA(Asn)/glutamyl-tRNA(Gln) amidotransferase subunit C
MAKLTEHELRQLSNLAKIEITKDELHPFQEDLNKILDFVASISQVSTENIVPFYSPAEGTQRLRDDVVTETNERDLMMNNAPKAEAGLFLVPKVIDACKVEE